VADYFLFLAKKNSPDKTAFITEALYYVGFGSIEGDYKQQLVVFDQVEMDNQWGAGAPNENLPYHSFQPIWDDVFEYIRYPFQVCQNPNSGKHEDTIANAGDCYERSIEIPEEAKANIKGMNYTEITGCPEGYPVRYHNYIV
jgi:hypothetical protein